LISKSRLMSFVVMTSYSDLEDMWNTPEAATRAKRFYWKCIVHLVRIIAIYFVCQYLFIPKT